MQTLSKLLFSVFAGAFLLSVAVSSAEACSGGAGMTVWAPSSQTVAESPTTLPPATPGEDG